VLAIPAKRLPSLAASPALDLAVASERLLPVMLMASSDGPSDSRMPLAICSQSL